MLVAIESGRNQEENGLKRQENEALISNSSQISSFNYLALKSSEWKLRSIAQQTPSGRAGGQMSQSPGIKAQAFPLGPTLTNQ